MGRSARVRLAVVLVVVVSLAGCAAKMPPDLTPPAQVAWRGIRVVRALDILRDATLALTPATFSDAEAAAVVRWHKTSLTVVKDSPGGWEPAVRSGIFALTCDPMASDTQPPPPCRSPLPAATVAKITPYVRITLIVLAEMQPKALRTVSEDILAAFQRLCAQSLGVDDAWLEAHLKA